MTGILPSLAPFDWICSQFFIDIGDRRANAFVLQQGLMRKHVGALVLFCSLSDAILIIVGVGGVAP